MEAGTDLERRVGDYMSGGHPAVHGEHGGHGAKKATKRKEHDVEPEHQKFYDEVLEEVFDWKWHRETTLKHNDAYITSLQEIKGKNVADRFSAEEALVDAIIKYRTEAGVPVSNKAEHRHHIYQEASALLDSYEKENKTSVDTLIKGGNLYKLLEKFHENESGENIGKKLNYELNKKLPHGKDPEFYQGLLKAHGNYTGQRFTKGKLARIGNRDGIISAFSQHYNIEMNRLLEEYVKEEKHDDHGHGAAHSGGHDGH